MIELTFPDGSKKQYNEGVTGLEIAEGISPQLAKNALAIKVGNDVEDLSRPIEESTTVQILTWDDEEGKHTFWHTSAHLMAEAVQELFPGTQFGIGPAIESGYYYDVTPPEGTVIRESDFVKIEQKMQELLKRKEKLVRKNISKANALEMFQSKGQTYKCELISELEDGNITIYQQGSYVDLCRGPHLVDTTPIKAVKVMAISAAFWRGDAKNPQMTRIYGISFPKKRCLTNISPSLKKQRNATTEK